MNSHLDNIIDEIMTFIKDNILLIYKFKDDSFVKLKYYMDDSNDINIPYPTLLSLASEVFFELINAKNLYDFRDLD